MKLAVRWAIATVAGLAAFAISWWALEVGAGWHLGDALGLAAVPFAIVFGVAGYWAGRESSSDEPGSFSGESLSTGIAALAERLALAVEEQWQKEAGIRRLYDPYPLPVSWTAADPALTDDWLLLEQLAGSADWRVPAGLRTWARGPEQLAGAGDGVAETLAKVPTLRLVVLGEPGAGKTILMVRLVLSLVHHRHPGDPVPLLVPLASWDPSEQDFRGWLRTQISIDHPELAAAAGSGAEALLAAGLILPILDGLDEIPAAVRGPAIALINDALGPGDGVVVTCRSAEYRRAIRPPEGPEITLRGAAAIELDPLDMGAVARYLLADAGGPVARAAWAPVIAALGTGAPVAQALTTPLMISLARIIYNPRPGESTSDALPHRPTELLSQELFPTREEVEHHLLDSFIWAAYRPGPSPPPRSDRHSWDYVHARRWLVFLARNQEENGTLDIAWWKLPNAAPRNLVAFILSLVLGIVAAIGYPFVGFGVGLTFGLLIGILVRRVHPPGVVRVARGIVGGLVGGIAAGIIELAVFGFGPHGYGVGAYLAGGIGLAIGVAPLASFTSSLVAGFTGQIVVAFYQQAPTFHLLRLWLGSGGSHVLNGTGAALAAMLSVQYSSRREVPAQGLRWSPIWFICGVSAAIIIGLIAWVQLGTKAGLTIGLAAVIVGTINGVVADVAASDPTKAAGPRAVLRRDRTTFLGGWLVFGIGLGLITGVTWALGPGPTGQPNGIRPGLEVGLTNVIVPAIGFGFVQALWGIYAVSRCWLAITGQLPLRFMEFLHDAHANRGVLRQVGAVYQFRHIDLQRRIATWPVTIPEFSNTVATRAQIETDPPRADHAQGSRLVNRAGMAGMCLTNAQRAAREHDVGYAEGLSGPSDAGHWILHAWNTDSTGRVIDPTWDDDSLVRPRYFGIRFAADDLPQGENTGSSVIGELLEGKAVS